MEESSFDFLTEIFQKPPHQESFTREEAVTNYTGCILESICRHQSNKAFQN
jgi:hypothetical protein